MIGYTTFGTNDLEQAGSFYDAVLGELGAKRVMTNERMILWGTEPGQPMFGVCIPYDQQTATAGNGTMIALNAGSQDKVQKMHAKALALGGSDEGAPGPRGGNFYGGYFRDLDGNKLVAFVMG